MHEAPTQSKGNSWFYKAARSVHARVWLVLLSFTESSVFIIPPDPLLAAMVYAQRSQWLRYALLTTVASLSGAVFGYVIGALLYNTIGAYVIELYNLQGAFEHAAALMREGVFFFTLTLAFTPIPFKAAVLAAGFTKANIFIFLIAALVGRAARYMAVAYITKVFGDRSYRVQRRLWRGATVIGVVLLVAYVAYKALG